MHIICYISLYRVKYEKLENLATKQLPGFNSILKGKECKGNRLGKSVKRFFDEKIPIIF